MIFFENLSIDETLKTPVNLNSWGIYYECSGELAINPQKGFYFYKDTLQQGDSLIFSTAIENNINAEFLCGPELEFYLVNNNQLFV